MKITKSQLRRIIKEEVNKLLKESRRPSEGWTRYLTPMSKNLALKRGDVDIPDDMRPEYTGTSTKKAKKELPDDRYRVGPAGMALKFDEGLLGTAKSKVKTKAAEIVFGALSDRLGELNAAKGADLVLALMKRLGAEKEVFVMLKSKLGAGLEKGGGSKDDEELGTTTDTTDTTDTPDTGDEEVATVV